MNTRVIGRTQRTLSLSGLLVTLALLAAACNPATPTPAILVSLVTATPTSTAKPAQPSTATATATATEIVVPDDTNSEVTPVGTAGTPPALDVCDLITDAEAAKILGEPITRAQSGTDAEGEPYPIHFCTWNVATPGLALVLSVTETGSPGEAVSMLEAKLASNEDDATADEDVAAEKAGVGERAYWTVAEHAFGYDVVTGSHVYILAVGGQVTPTDALRAALLELAKSVSGRL